MTSRALPFALLRVVSVLTFKLLNPRVRRLQELLEKCHPLGMFDGIASLAVAQNVQDIYKLVLIDTPLARYFSENLSSEDLDEMNIEILRNTLYNVRPPFLPSTSYSQQPWVSKGPTSVRHSLVPRLTRPCSRAGLPEGLCKVLRDLQCHHFEADADDAWI